MTSQRERKGASVSVLRKREHSLFIVKSSTAVNTDMKASASRGYGAVREHFHSLTLFTALVMMNEVYACTNILNLQRQKCFSQGQVAWRAALVSLWPGLSTALMDEVVDQRLC